MNDLTKLYRKLDARDRIEPDADALARMAAVGGENRDAGSAEAAIVALARDLEPESQQLVETLRGPTVVPFAARLRQRAWIPAALAAGVALAAVLLMPGQQDIEAPQQPIADETPVPATVPSAGEAPAGDEMFAMSFEPGDAPAQESDAVFNGDFDS